MAKLLPPSSCPLAELPHPLPGSVSLAQALPGDSSAWGCCTKPEGRLKSSAPHQSDSAIHRTISMITAKSEISQGEITTGLSLLHNELQETPWWPSPNTGKVFSMHHQHCSVPVWGCSTEIPNTLLSRSCQQEPGAFQLFTTCTQQKSTQQHPCLADTQHPEDTGMNDLGWVLPVLPLLHGTTKPLSAQQKLKWEHTH